MRPQTLLTAALAGYMTPAASQSLPSLYDALDAAGASKFAALIQADAGVSDLYGSGAIKTVFAPSDAAVIPSALSRRDTTSESQLEYQACKDQTRLAEASSGANGGVTLNTGLNAPGLGGTPQKALVDTRPANATNVSKRWNLSHRAANTSISLLKIEAGLGAVSNVIQADIAFDGGTIHITDSYFTLPESLSSTAALTGQTTFNSLANSSNLTSTLDNAQFVTVFLPSNAAFDAANSNSSTLSSSQLISNHVVSGFVGYLPALVDGLTLTTENGGVLTVSVRNDIWYINGAIITQANLILENGVAHVIDKVLLPAPKPATVTSSGTLAAALKAPSPVLALLASLVLLF
ncbi:beta-ig-h3 fasciclin [Niveomyces insectorum RCEF 264]|uniref:Beta-ig-h3 fasciclin n=1 Tax=Niveomyces insectorum RCEF 264 TaxID=1081102 RepID=A0A167XTP9_9HYPO|nr:beta-ig-h3 fasciclin [Niveomyces insectorum RCEF 264]